MPNPNALGNTDPVGPDEAPKKKRGVLTFEQRVERLLTPQRNAFDRAQKRWDKARAELDAAQAELSKAKADYDRAKRLASSDEAPKGEAAQ